jgi:hypothetical protein
MTYIIGFRSQGINSIISDTRVSYWTGAGPRGGENVVLKTGLLFPGCLFGRAGSAPDSQRFILSAKYALTRKPVNTVQGFWADFMRFAESYDYPSDNDSAFRILLSTRASGDPQFYVLDSQQGLSRVDESWVSLGTGKKLLDQLVEQGYSGWISQMQNALPDDSFQNELPPYLLCLWMNELSRSFEGRLLEQVGVGGVFHFVFQAQSGDYCQKPALYVINDIDKGKKTILSWQYRLCYVKQWLIVDTLIPPKQLADFPNGKQERIALLDEASLPPRKKGAWDRDDLYRDLREDLEDELAKQPFYFFCGFGYTNPVYRKNLVFHVTTEGDYIVEDGRLAPGVIDMLIDGV